ncbi:MAG: DUF1636 domain-containing protein [Cyanobacteriota bacterium]
MMTQAQSQPLEPDTAKPHCLLVCTTCGSQWVNGKRQGTSQGETLLNALQSKPRDPRLHLQPVECMSGCSHACVVGLAAPDKTTYVFGDLDPEDTEAILATAQLYLAKPDGILPWAERPLKRGVIARIPPLGCV